MKTKNQNSRRKFLSVSIKSTMILGGAATLGGSILTPILSMAQNADAVFQTKIAKLGTASLQTSELALTKASNVEVKMFAKFEVAEQQAISNILKDMGTVVPAPSEEGKAILTMLKSLSGLDFDKAFMQAQVDTHKKLKEAVTALMNASTNKYVKHISSLALGTIQEHTERGQMLLHKL